MKEIILTQGQRALVDDADFDWLSQWNWRAQYCKNGPFYAARTVHGGARTPGWGRWKAKVKGIHLGYFSTAEEAALAYNTAAKQHFGEFAKPNVLIGG